MKYKLIDIREQVETGVEFGTCELCSYIGDLEKRIFIFHDENKNITEIEGGSWDWGSYYDETKGINFIEFAELVSNKEFGNIEEDFDDLIREYYETYECYEDDEEELS